MRVYVAGPLTRGNWMQNVRAAADAADALMAAGHTPFLPHLSVFWEFASHKPYETWLAWCLEWVGQCDALLRLPGESAGADREVARATELGIPVWKEVADADR